MTQSLHASGWRSKLRRSISSLSKCRAINRVTRAWHLGGATPTSRVFGYDRGPQSIARYYIDSFIAEHAQDICGRVLELGDDRYTRQFGSDRVVQSDVLNVAPGTDGTTVVADLTQPNQLRSERYDCVILTQGLQFMYDVKAAVACVFKILKPGGVFLSTMSGISQISRYDMDRWGEYWRFTSTCVDHLFKDVFPSDGLTIKTYGNVLSAVALLQGLASRELRRTELDSVDPDYEVIIGARAVKISDGGGL